MGGGLVACASSASTQFFMIRQRRWSSTERSCPPRRRNGLVAASTVSDRCLFRHGNFLSCPPAGASKRRASIPKTSMLSLSPMTRHWYSQAWPRWMSGGRTSAPPTPGAHRTSWPPRCPGWTQLPCSSYRTTSPMPPPPASLHRSVIPRCWSPTAAGRRSPTWVAAIAMASWKCWPLRSFRIRWA